MIATRRLILAGLAGLAGCSSWLPKPQPAPQRFALDADGDEGAPPAAKPAPNAPTLVVAVPRAAPGFDTSRIVYLREVHAIEAFAYSEWVDAPAQMLAPLLVRALERSGAFRAVLRAPTAAAADLRLDTELLRLQQDFRVAPSQVRLTLRAMLVDTATRGVVGWQEFDASVAATSEDAAGGVRAANQAARIVLAELAAFAARAAAR